jgi:hypothetical protein
VHLPTCNFFQICRWWWLSPDSLLKNAQNVVLPGVKQLESFLSYSVQFRIEAETIIDFVSLYFAIVQGYFPASISVIYLPLIALKVLDSVLQRG